MIEHPPTARSPDSSVLLMVSILFIAGCASFSPDSGFDSVVHATTDRGLQQQAKWLRNDQDTKQARERITQLLADPVSADAAVQIALLSNRALQARYADLGIAESDVIQAGRLRNPGFSFSRLRRADEIEIERTFLLDLLGLLTMPIRTDLEKRRFELTKIQVSAEVLQVAADTRRVWNRAVSAQESVKYAEQVKDAAEASAELARRMAAAGNFSKLDHAREHAFYADATAQLARSKQVAHTERERLTQFMGLSGSDLRFVLPERLPDLPAAPREVADIEGQAMRQRLDMQAAMKNAENIGASLGLTRVAGFVNVLELGYQRNSETGRSHQTGYEIEVRLPLFDWGGARNARAELTYQQAVDLAADMAVKTRSEVRDAYNVYRTAYDLAKHYRDEVVPLRKRILEENVLRYNGMLISVFELLAGARQQIASVNAYIEALRDFWLADATLDLAINGKSPGPITSLSSAASGSSPETARGH